MTVYVQHKGVSHSCTTFTENTITGIYKGPSMESIASRRNKASIVFSVTGKLMLSKSVAESMLTDCMYAWTKTQKYFQVKRQTMMVH